MTSASATPSSVRRSISVPSPLHALLLEHERKGAPRASRADDCGAVQLVRVALHQTLAELFNLVRQTDEVGVVARQEHIVAVGDDHAVIAEDESREHTGRELQRFQRRARDRGFAPDARLKETHLALTEVLHVERGWRHEDAVDFARRNQLRIEREVDVKIFLEIGARLHRKVHVTDAGDRVGDAVFLREYAGDHVHLVALCDGDENVRPLNVGIVHRERT